MHRAGERTPSGDGDRGGDNSRGDLGTDGGRELDLDATLEARYHRQTDRVRTRTEGSIHALAYLAPGW